MLWLGLMLLAGHSGEARLYLNEIMVQNESILADEQGDYDDWVELYNAGQLAIDIGGMYLSDDPKEPLKWRVPEDAPALSTIAAGGYLLLWLDDEPASGPLHAGFKLSATGEELALYNREGMLLDRVVFDKQRVDVSYGRVLDGSDEWRYLAQASPSAANQGKTYRGISGEVQFSRLGGLYSTPLTLELHTAAPGARIYVTRDGSDPKALDSLLYTGPLYSDTTIVLRAQAIEDDMLPGDVISHSYLLEVRHDLPIVSLVGDPRHFWDWETGIYVLGPNADTAFPHFNANYWQDWERPVHLEYFTDGGRAGFRLNAGVKISGGWTRPWPKKSFTIMTRSKYGAANVNYPVFEDLDLETFDGLQLRADAWNGWRMKNELVYEINKAAGAHVDMQAYQPAVLYINGEYWGIYNVMERKDNDFIANHHGYRDVDIIESNASLRDIKAGDAENYHALLAYLNANDLNRSSVYRRLQDWIDIDNFIDYWIYEIFIAKVDNVNIRYWRPRQADGRWRWIAYDHDMWADKEDSTLHRIAALDSAHKLWLLGRMLHSHEFRNSFINRFADLLNTVLSPAEVQQTLTAIIKRIESEMPRNLQRWYRSVAEIPKRIAWMEAFIKARAPIVRRHILEEFDLADTNRISFDVNIHQSGRLRISTLEIEDFPWRGIYFKGVPIAVEAIPNPGFVFSGWSDTALGTTRSILVDPAERSELQAKFERQDSERDWNVIINEINYKSAPEADAGDWLELINPTHYDLNIEGWVLRDANAANAYVFPPGTIVAARSFVVVARDLERFSQVFPEAHCALGSLGFGLSADGDALRLYTADGLPADELWFSSKAPWPAEANGSGSTLVLTDHSLDNFSAGSWNVSEGYGSPCEFNRVVQLASDIAFPEPALAQNRPNPFRDGTKLQYVLPYQARVAISIYDQLGKLVDSMPAVVQDAGNYSVYWQNPASQQSGETAGLYVCRLIVEPLNSSRRISLIRKMLYLP